VLWKIFGPQTEEVRENWRKMSREELHGLSKYDDQVKGKEMDGKCGMYETS